MGLFPEVTEVHRQRLFELSSLNVEVDHKVVGSKNVAGSRVPDLGEQFDGFFPGRGTHSREIAVLPSANEYRHRELLKLDLYVQARVKRQRCITRLGLLGRKP